MNRAALSCTLSLLAGLACSPTATPPSDVIRLALRATVAAHEERHVCQVVRMPEGGGELFVRGGGYTTTPGTHHFLLFRTAPFDAPVPEGRAFDCFEGSGVMRFERGFVTGGQLREEKADFPEGAALAFAPGEVLLFQAHVLNPGDAPMEARVDVELRTAPASRVKWRVGTYRFYDPFIHVPARGRATAKMRCPVPRDVTIVSAGSHMHRLGTGYRAFLDAPGAPPATAPFFTTDDWQHPPYFHGPLEARAGSHVRFECDYANTGEKNVGQGIHADDEMCMFSAFYYPAGDRAEEECHAMDEHGTGERSCAQTLSCVQLCPIEGRPRFGEGRADVGECWQRCITQSAPNATGALFPELTCSDRECRSACDAPGASCAACVLGHCKRELDACQALASDAQARPPVPSEDAIDPIALGRKWTYDVKEVGEFPMCPSGTHTSEVLGATSHQGRAAFEATSPCKNGGTITYAQDGDVVMQESYGSWALALDAPVVDGHRWTNGVSTYVWRDAGSVAVPAGTFDRCFRAQDERGPSYTTFCRGVGPVEVKYRDAQGNGFDAALVAKTL